MVAVTISSIIDEELNRLLEIEAQNAEMTKSAYIKKMIKEKLKTGTSNPIITEKAPSAPIITEKSASVPVITEKPQSVPVIEKEPTIVEIKEKEKSEAGLITLTSYDLDRLLDYVDRAIKNVDDKVSIVENRIRAFDIEGWLNRFRRLLIRWEKKVENYSAMLHFACAWITFRAAGLFG